MVDFQNRLNSPDYTADYFSVFVKIYRDLIFFGRDSLDGAIAVPYVAYTVISTQLRINFGQ